MTLNQRLIELVKYMQDQMREFQIHLNQDQITAEGTFENWSPKDSMFHALIWAERRLEILETLERGEAWSDIDYGDYEDANREIFNEHRHKSWEDVQTAVKNTYSGVLDYLGRIDEKVLLSVKEGEERTFWRSIVDNYVLHPMIHLWDLLVKGGKIEMLAGMFGEEFSKLLLALDDSEIYQGGMLYNKACLNTLTGNLEYAIQTLDQALKLAPGLIEWSKQDSDLDALRDIPAYLALYKD